VGRSTPDGPPATRRARCSYCGRGGPELTQCEGCGATVPEASSRPRPAFPANRVIREGFGGFDELAKKLEELDDRGEELWRRLRPPAFPMVKR